ncbi:hypothetical protein ACT9SR_13540, partial [Enterococcus faecalis]|uniref:hypothetical protein n=1 Tax=Enterococcus faecalis TaxID=1351 RepID=UPI00403907B4
MNLDRHRLLRNRYGSCGFRPDNLVTGISAVQPELVPRPTVTVSVAHSAVWVRHCHRCTGVFGY